MIKLTAFRWVPPIVQGLVRDLRVRWALEEAGLPYEERLIGLEEKANPAYRALQPFGQVPAIEDGDFKLFESGAIVHHIAANSEVLMPSEPKARARTIAWMWAALTSVELFVGDVVAVDILYSKENWAKEHRPGAVAMAQTRLDDIEAWLGDRDFLEDRFTAGDLLMSTVLRELRHTDIVTSRPKLHAYHQRCEARPAFRKALADHMRPFATSVAA